MIRFLAFLSTFDLLLDESGVDSKKQKFFTLMLYNPPSFLPNARTLEYTSISDLSIYMQIPNNREAVLDALQDVSIPGFDEEVKNGVITLRLFEPSNGALTKIEICWQVTDPVEMVIVR